MRPGVFNGRDRKIQKWLPRLDPKSCALLATLTSQPLPSANGPVCTTTLLLLSPVVNSSPELVGLTPRLIEYRPMDGCRRFPWATPLCDAVVRLPSGFTCAPTNPAWN